MRVSVPAPSTPRSRGISKAGVIAAESTQGGHPTPAGYPMPSSQAVTAVMRGNRRSDTGLEVRVRSELHRRGFRFRKQLLIAACGIRVRADVAFPRQRLAIFLDGCFWHRCPEHGNSPRSNSAYWSAKLDRNVERDLKVLAALSSEGWRVLRIWEHVPADLAADQVQAALTECMAVADAC